MLSAGFETAIIRIKRL